MKFFTLEAYHSTDDDKMESLEDWGQCYVAYDLHLENMREVLPDSLLEISSQNTFDDGLVTRVRHDKKKQKLEIRLRCGNLMINYYDMVLTYEGARISAKDDRMLATIARTTTWGKGWKFDCHNHELDVNSNGEIVHRFLFNPGISFEIVCTSITWKKIPKPGRRLGFARDRYIGGPSEDLALLKLKKS